MLDGTIPPEDYMRIKDRVKPMIDGIESKMRKLKKDHAVDIDVVSAVFNFTTDIHETYIKVSERVQKKLIGFFFKRFEVKDSVIIGFEYSPLFTELLRLNSLSLKTPKHKKAFDNKEKGLGILDLTRGAHRELNPN